MVPPSRAIHGIRMTIRPLDYVLLGCLLVVAFCLTTACTNPDLPSDYYHLSKNEWACTTEHVTSIKPYMKECVTYRRLK